MVTTKDIRMLYEEGHRLLAKRREIIREINAETAEWSLRLESMMSGYFNADVYEEMHIAGLHPEKVTEEIIIPSLNTPGTPIARPPQIDVLTSVEDDLAAIGKGGKGTGKRFCGNCGKGGHRKTTCPEPVKDANVPVGGRACSKCRKPGHRSTTCPN